MPSNIKDVTPGSMVTFRSKNANDPIVYKGILEIAVATYKGIRAYENPAAYNQAVRQTDNTVPSDETVLNYFLITIDNNAADTTEKVFANEWIEPGSLAVVNPGNKVTIMVDDPKNDPNQIIALLASAGYFGRIIS